MAFDVKYDPNSDKTASINYAVERRGLHQHNPDKGRADFMDAALEWDAADARVANALSGSVDLVEAVMDRREAVARAKAALAVWGGASCIGVDALRVWKKITGESGIGVVVSKELVDSLFDVGAATEQALPSDI